ncbi:hypothetical protein TWF730_003858 [Orbilia blumenaviensis]|uniref:WW domain-containing protein n=1 Tax=Orbilia blumenaviensis TaxID=1796055 RepID=A0AAV9U3E9_9PEZI
MTTGTASSTPPLDEQNGLEPPKSPSKPLARTRSPTPPVDEPSRKRRRPESPSSKEPRNQAIETAPDVLESNEVDPKTKVSPSAAEQSTGDASNVESAKDPVSDREEEAEEEEEEAEEGELPPLPPGPPPEEPPSDGWEAIWEPTAGQYYFYNRHTGETTWTNPRVPPTEAESTPIVNTQPEKPVYTGYDPAIHGDYDPTASYAQQPERTPSPTIDPYVAHAAFNRFTGKFQAGAGTERYTDESRAKRQMEIYFDVDAAANCHDGRSLKAERQAKKLTKKEVKAFREKTRLKKEEKKRAWLRD